MNEMNYKLFIDHTWAPGMLHVVLILFGISSRARCGDLRFPKLALLANKI